MKLVIDFVEFDLEIPGNTIQHIYDFLLNEQLITPDSQFICNGKILQMSDPIPNTTIYVSTKKQVTITQNKDNMMDMMDNMQPFLKGMDKETFKSFLKSSHKNLTTEQINGMYEMLKNNNMRQLMQSSDMQLQRLEAQGYMSQVMPHLGLDELENAPRPRMQMTNPIIHQIETQDCVQGELNDKVMPNPFSPNRNKKK
eukprot:NODE_604_length_5488_cov_0.125997.p2 type:complete len:198 gc:universal NODE_604_length_5488_cov_0.125997:837-244(-)